jgi:hypothetical protein
MIELIILSLSFTSIFISTFVFQEKTILYISQACLAILSFVALYRLYEADTRDKVKQVLEKPAQIPPAQAGKKVDQENQKKYEALKTKFMEMADTVKSPAGEKESDVWDVVLTRSSTKADSVYKIQVHQKKGSDFIFRIIVEMDTNPEEAFDYLSDISRRSEWDEICTGAGTIEVLDSMTSIQFMKTRGFWPTAPRDALVISFVDEVKPHSFLNVTTSIPSHASYISDAGDVRMLAHIAGTFVEPHPSVEGACLVTQVVDGDLQGWLPKSVVALVSTQAFPISLAKAHKWLKNNKRNENPPVSRLVKAATETPTGDKMLDKITESKTKPSMPVSSSQAVGTHVGNSPLQMILRILTKSQPFIILALVFALFRRRS